MAKPCENCIDVTKLGCGPLSSDNIIYTGPNLPCSNINTNEVLTAAIQRIDAILCGIAGTQGLQETLTVGNTSTDIPAIFRTSANSNLSTLSFEGIKIEDSSKYINFTKEGIYFSLSNTTIKPESPGGALVDLLVPTKSIPGTYVFATVDQIPSSANFVTTGALNQVKTGNLTVNAIIKAGGTGFEYLMADGSTSNLNTIILAILTSNISSGDTTHAPTGDTVYNALILKENLSNKVNVISGSSATEYPTENAVVSYVTTGLNLKEDVANKVDVISGSSSIEYPTEKAVVDYVTSQIGEDFAKIVYFNNSNPALATIFDLNNPPVTNDNSLKDDINNLYIGLDASTWVYITSPAGYITKAITSFSSNFYFGGTLIDAGGDKNSAIERAGTVGGAPATADNHFVTKAQSDLNTENSAGAIQGFTLTDNGNGTVNISSGTAYLRATNDQYAPLVKYTIPGVTNLALTDNTNNFVLVDYNGGTPALTVTTNTAIINTETNSLALAISRVGTILDYQSLVGQNHDANAKLRVRFLNQEGIRRASGAGIGFSARNLTLTAGVLFSGLIRINTPAFNTGTGSTFTMVYNAGVVWTRVTGQTQVNNTQYNNAGVLTNLGGGDFRTDYIYLLANNPSKLYSVLGTTSYPNITQARTATPPTSLPSELQVLGVLVGRSIIQRLGANISEVSSAFDTVFPNSPVPEHNALAGLQGGAVNDYIHLTTVEKTLALRTSLSYACSDEVSDLSVGTLITFRMPVGLTLTSLKLSLNTAPTGSKLIVDVRKGGVTILSTLISVDISSTTSVGAAVPYVISDPNLVDDSIITILTTQVGSVLAGKGLKVTFIGNKL